jgi:steroid delta-isomerase-like uncharacterized protein
MEENKQIVLKFFDLVWNQRKLEVADLIIDKDCLTHQLRSGEPETPVPRGPDSIKNHVTGWLASFHDLRFTVEQMTAEADRVSTLLLMEGTHTGEWMGVPPSGKQISIRLMTIHRLQSCKIIEDWVIVESLGLFQQLGIVRPTAELFSQFQQGKDGYLAGLLRID